MRDLNIICFSSSKYRWLFLSQNSKENDIPNWQQTLYLLLISQNFCFLKLHCGIGSALSFNIAKVESISIHFIYQQFSIAFDMPAKACTSPGPDTTRQTAGLKVNVRNYKNYNRIFYKLEVQ